MHCLDSKNLKENIKKILIKFCVPAPIVFSDVNYLSTSAPPSAAEWCSFLRPLRGREPEGMWNLLSIVREMYRRNDRNSIPLLEIVTQQCLETNQIMVWWFNTKVAALQQRNHGGGGGGGNGGGGGKHNVSSNSQASQNACASLCDEIVSLWKLAALNPCISPAERGTLRKKLVEYHQTVIEKVQANQGGATGSVVKPVNPRTGRPSDLELFSGFKPAIEACGLGWQDYPIAGVTFGQNSHYLCPFFKSRDGAAEGEGVGCGGSGGFGGGSDLQHASQVNCSEAVLRCEYPGGRPRPNSGNSNLVQDPQQPPPAPADGDAARATDRRESVESFDSLHRRTEVSNSAFEAPGRPNLEQQSSEEVVSDEGVAGVKVGNASTRGASTSGNESSSGQDADSAQEDSKEKTEEPPRGEVGQDPVPPAPGGGGGGEDEQYRVYFYNPRVGINLSSTANCGRSGNGGGPVSLDVFRNLRRTIEDPWEVLFMRAEGLHAHGYQARASSMAVELAHQLLKNPPDLIGEMCNATSAQNAQSGGVALSGQNGGAPSAGGAKPKNQNKRRKMAMSHHITTTASTTLSHCAFLTTVLSENPAHHNLAFRVGMFGLEMARPPASTKPMEVRLAHQESELVALLKKLPLGPAEMRILKDRAAQLRDGTMKSRGEALLPLMLASYVFDSLVTSRPDDATADDKLLGFDAAVATIGMKANASEADHPLLCEGSRRQRGELALSLLVYYKDQPDKVARIMDKLLDKDINLAFKSPLNPDYYVLPGGRRQQQQQQHDDLSHRLGNLGLHALPPAAAAADNPPPPPQPFGGAGGLPLPSGAGPGNIWDSYESWEQEREQRAAAGQPGGRQAPSGLRREQMFQQAPGGAAAALRQPPPRAGSDSGSSGNSSGDSIVSSSSSSRRNNSMRNNQEGLNHSGNGLLGGGGGGGASGGGLFLPPAGVPPPSLVSDHRAASHQHDRPPPPLGGAAAANALSAAAAMAATGGARHM